MATTGRLNIFLNADTATLNSKLAQATRNLSSSSAKMNRSLAVIDRGFKRVGKSAARFGKSMVGFRGAAVLAAGVAGLGLLVKRSLDTADSIAKASDAIGISTDALQEYRFAAGQSGVATDKLDKALKRATKSIGELRTRTSSELSTALKDFDSQLLSNIRSAGSVEQALDMVFRTMGRLEDQTKRVALATAVFGRGGVDLVNIVRDGEQALDRFRQQARDLGLVLEERLLRGAEKAKDQLAILSQVLSTNVTSAVLEAAPEIERLAKAFSDGVPDIIDWVKEFSVFMGLIDTSKVDRLQEIADEIDRINQAMKTPVTGFLVEMFSTERLAKLKAEAAEIRKALIAANPITERFPRPTPNVPEITGPAGSFIPRRKDLGAAEDASIRFEIQREAAEEAAKASQILQSRIDAETEAARRNLDVIFSTVETNRERYDAELKFIAETKLALMDKAQLTAESEAILERGAVAARERFEEAERAAAKANQVFEETNRVAERMAFIFDNTLESAIRGNIRSWNDLGNVAINVLQSIIIETLRSQQALSGFGSLLGGLGGGGGLTGLLSGVLGLFGGATPLASAAALTGIISPFAHGGPIAAGQLALVGEKGPELFKPDVAGTIIPNMAIANQTFGAGGGGGGSGFKGATVFIDARGTNNEVIAALFKAMRQLGTDMPKIAIGAVQDARRRNPGLFR